MNTVLTLHTYRLELLRVSPAGLYQPPAWLEVQAPSLGDALRTAREMCPYGALIVRQERDWRDYV